MKQTTKKRPAAKTNAAVPGISRRDGDRFVERLVDRLAEKHILVVPATNCGSPRISKPHNKTPPSGTEDLPISGDLEETIPARREYATSPQGEQHAKKIKCKNTHKNHSKTTRA